MTTMTTMKGRPTELLPVEQAPDVIRARETLLALQAEDRTLADEDRQIGRALLTDKLATDPMPDPSAAERIALVDRRQAITVRRRVLVSGLNTATARLTAAREEAFTERIGPARARVAAKLDLLWQTLGAAVAAQEKLDEEVKAVNGLLGRVTFNAMGWPSLGEEVASRRSQGWPS